MANDPSLDGDAALAPARLRCEGLTDPMCVESAAPRFSWEVCSARRGEHQTAYRLLVASSPESLADDVGDLWDSGRVASDETLHVPYGGAAPGAARRCWWKVRVWDAAGRASAWSAPATFGTALDAQRWEAQWIGFDHCRELDAPPAPFDGAQWIWLGGDEAEADAGLFVGVLELPPGVEVVDSTLALSVSGRYRFFWGPEQFARSDDLPRPWRRPYIRHMNERLGPGRNTFRVWAERIEGEPAGVLFKLTARTGDGRVFTLRSDAGWRASRVSDPAGAPSGVASWPSCRELGAYGSEPWGALRGEENFLPPPAQLRREFSIPRTVRRATLYATALGLYDLRLNGRRVHESYFDPGWTDYRKRLHYRAYDVTDHLHEGDNAWGVVLADGWYSGYVGWLHQRDLYGRHPRFRGTLRVEYEDAAVESFHTGPAWRASTGPIREADLLMGETFDARRAQTGWTRPGYDDADWAPVSTGAEVSPALHPHPAQPVVALRSEAFTPRSIAQPEPGVFVFDLGQNFAGVVELRVRNAEPGREITIRHGERLRGDGTLYTRNLRTARATDTYICRGDPEEAWSPRFTFHGFQYVEVTGLPHEPDADTLTGLPLSSDTPLVGGFECSDPLANRLARNVYWSQRSNFIDIPTDCPQRDERLGWCDAAWTFLGAGALRADVQQFYNKWMRDLDDAQHPDGLFPWLAPLVVTTPDSPMWIGSSPGWADAGVICPWEIYHRYADRRQLQEHYPNMVRQVEWYRRTSRDDLLPPPGHACLGDWLNENAPVPLDVFRTAFFAHSADLTARAAQALGKSDDARRFRELHRGVAHAFRHAYVHEDGTIDGDTQGGYALALVFDLLDDAQRRAAADHLVRRLRDDRGLLTTGLEATLPLMLALSRIGRSDLAYRLLHNEDYPSWNFSIRNGATTIWERWDSWTPEKGFGDANMNSFNHFSLGAVYQWMVEVVGGIRCDASACRRITVAPVPGGRLTHAHVAYHSPRGLVRCDWNLHDRGLDLRIEIPANTTAALVLPAAGDARVTESGRPVELAPGLRLRSPDPDGLRLDASSGAYRFHVTEPLLARCDPRSPHAAAERSEAAGTPPPRATAFEMKPQMNADEHRCDRTSETLA